MNVWKLHIDFILLFKLLIETELCCGSVFLPFVDPVSQTQIVNKNYDLLLFGGSIYDKNVPLDPEIARNSKLFETCNNKLNKNTLNLK